VGFGRGSEWFVDPARESIDNVLSISKKLINEKRYGVSALSSFFFCISTTNCKLGCRSA